MYFAGTNPLPGEDRKYFYTLLYFNFVIIAKFVVIKKVNSSNLNYL